jgi:hypothetical protein
VTICIVNMVITLDSILAPFVSPFKASFSNLAALCSRLSLFGSKYATLCQLRASLDTRPPTLLPKHCSAHHSPRRIIIPRNNPMNSTSLSHVNNPQSKIKRALGY